MVITILNALDDALNYHNIERHPQRISKLKPYINNEIIRQLLLIYYLYIQYRNNDLLMITDGKKWHYLAVTNLCAFSQKNHQMMMEIFIV